MKGLGEGLAEDGWHIDEVVVYTTDAVSVPPASVAALAAGEVPVVVLRSPTAVRAVARFVPVLAPGTVPVCGGPTTAAEVTATWGVAPVVAEGPTAEEVARRVVAVLQQGGSAIASSSRPEEGVAS
jgi:uroporphyrinogen decarboxylase